MYIVKVGDKYLRITRSLRLKLVDDTISCAYWKSKVALNTWRSMILKKYPDAQFKRAKFIEIDED